MRFPRRLKIACFVGLMLVCQTGCVSSEVAIKPDGAVNVRTIGYKSAERLRIVKAGPLVFVSVTRDGETGWAFASSAALLAAQLVLR